VMMNKRLEQRERDLKNQQDMEKASERQMKEMSATSDITTGLSNDFAAEERQKIQDYEEAFKAIKDSTGVSDVNEVIQKFLTQEDTQKNLQELTKQNQDTIDRLTEEKKRLRLQVEELKFSSGGGGGRRQAIDDFEKHLGEASEKFDRNKSKFERIAKMLIDMKAGIAHLSEKLVVVKLDGEASIEMSDETVEEVLQQSELKISKLLSLTAHLDNEDDMRIAERYEEKLMMRSQSDARIKLTDKHEDAEDDDDEFEEEIDEDVAHRKQVKYNSEQILEKQQTRKSRKAKGKKD